MDEVEWVDGRGTAGPQSASVKYNHQLPEGSPAARQLGDMVLEALSRCPLFISAAIPLKIFPPLFNRYGLGQHFGTHEVKLPAGDLVLYPSTSLHHVKPVTRGARVASFFWLQSMVREDSARSLLFDLDQTIQQLSGERGVEDPACVRLTGIYHNLIRHWADA